MSLLRLLAPSAIQAATVGNPVERASEKGDHYGHKANQVAVFSHQGHLIYLVSPGSPGSTASCTNEKHKQGWLTQAH